MIDSRVARVFAEERTGRLSGSIQEFMSDIRVLFVTQYYPPEMAATGQLLAELAEDLVLQGFRVTVLAGRPSYGLIGANAHASWQEARNGVEVVRSYSTRFPRAYFPGRAANWLSYPVSSLLRGVTGVTRPDIVVGYTAPPTVPPLAYLLARRWRARFVLYVHDVYPHIAQAVGALRNGTFFRTWRAVNRMLYKRADAVVTLGDYMAARLRDEGVRPERISVVHNWADKELLYPVPGGGRHFRDALGLGHRFVVLYSGNLGMAHDFKPVRDAIALLCPYRDRLAFLFIGDGVRRREMEDFVRTKNFEDFVIFRDYMPRDELLAGLNVGDAGLVTILKGTAGLVVPSKLYAYMAVGLPILTVSSEPCEVADIVLEYQCGYIAASGEELSSAIVKVMQDPDLASTLRQNTRKTFEDRFERRQATALIGRVLKSVVSEVGYPS